MLRRLKDVPLAQRVIRLANATATPVLCGPFRLTHVVEYPKCGGSWIRNMLSDYLGVPPYLGDRLLSHDDVVQSHRMFRASYRWPVVVVRDPRDLYVSFYYHETHLEGRETFRPVEKAYRHDPHRDLREDFAAYLRAKIAVPRREQPRFSYSDFVRSWNRRERACVVRYEDFLADPESELTRVLQYLGRPVDGERVCAVVAAHRFEAATRAAYGRARSPGEADASKFIRKGVAGDWKNHFDRDSCHILDRYEGWALRELGYESDESWIERFERERSSSPPGRT